MTPVTNPLDGLRHRLEVVTADITTLAVDAIVNAANTTLLGGAGVDGAIHRAAGPELADYCRALGGCPTGDAVLTPGFALPARFILHAVGPVWHGGSSGETDLLASCYNTCLRLCDEHGLRAVAFPCISTGAYSYPVDEACRVATTAVGDWLRGHALPDRVIFCCFDPADAALYRRELGFDA